MKKTTTLGVPPLKTQGIKTRIVPFISSLVKDVSFDTWIEPFMGSGVVAFNVKPKTAILSDSNPYITNFYNALKRDEINVEIVKEYLEIEGSKLKNLGESYYYEVRDRFNLFHKSLDFLFLNRSCFNGMVRFNRKGSFNVPYGHKSERFSKAYITKICNQIKYVQKIITDSDFTFVCQDFEKTISNAPSSSLIYCDPPYIGRSVDYYDSWDLEKERRLHDVLSNKATNFVLSTWKQTKYRENVYIKSIWKDFKICTAEHFYFIGAKESNRNSVTEALIYNF